MDLEKRTVIFGFHDQQTRSSMKEYLEAGDYKIKEADNLEAMKKLITENPHSVGYWMDTNFGVHNDSNPSSSVEIYKIVEDRVKAGKAMFLASSSNKKAVQAAIEAGIPQEYVLQRPFDMKPLLQKLNEIQ